MAEVVKTLPPEAGVLPLARRAWYLVTFNRVRIGLSCLAVTMFVGTYVDDGNIKAHRRLEAVEMLIAAVCGLSIGAGKFKSNEFHEAELQAEVRETSGQYPVYQRRASDKE